MSPVVVVVVVVAVVVDIGDVVFPPIGLSLLMLLLLLLMVEVMLGGRSLRVVKSERGESMMHRPKVENGQCDQIKIAKC